MLAEHYPVKPGFLYGGEYPGDLDPSIARGKIASLVEAGIRTFLDLTTPADRLLPYEHILRELEQEKAIPLQRIGIPVRDMDIPDTPETMRKILGYLHSSPPAVYVHCWGGIGRTGTVIGCWLREAGLNPDQALARVQQLYSAHMPKSHRIPEAPQTTAQKHYVRNWEPAP